MTRCRVGAWTALLLAVHAVAACSKPAAPLQSAAPVPVAAAKPRQDAYTFWREFRAAVLADDREKVNLNVRFPFVTRGPSDYDPLIQYSRETFAALYDKVMQADPGLSPVPQTQRQYIELHPDPPPIATGGGNTRPVPLDAEEFSAGLLTFKKQGERWYWVMAYLEEDP